MPDKQKTPSPAELVAAADDGAKTADEIDYAHCMAKLRACREWIRLNPDRVADMERYAMNEAAHGRKFAIKTIIERIRWFDYVNSAGQPVKISNDYAPIFARMLIDKHPELAQFIQTRPSMFDRLGVGVSWA